MDKKTYLEDLAKKLRRLQKEEQQEIIADYEEHFELASEKGRSDSEIIRGLGAPSKLAKEILVQYEITKAGESPSLNSVSKAVFAAVGLGLFNLVFVLAPFIVFLIVPVVLFGSAVIFLASPGLLLIQDGLTWIFRRSV